MDDIESFSDMFPTPPGMAQRDAREKRALKERRTQQTDKQRRRKAVRTTQINFRCSPAFKDRAAVMAKDLDCGIADLMEMALEELTRAKGIKGGADSG
jgi:hypothetical protein